jgi:DNA-binding NarL/FixJ family response regulator
MGISIILADDHTIVRQGLAALLEREAGFDIIGQANDGLELVALARNRQPAVVVTDITMPGLNGFEAIHRVAALTPSPKVVCLSVHGDPRLVRAALDAGASAYLVKGCGSYELVLAIRAALAGQPYLSAGLAKDVIHGCRSSATSVEMPAHMLLSTREREVMQLFAEGHSTHEIAQRLHISEKTIATHREHIMQKLHITGIAELTRYAIREGLCSACLPCPARLLAD